MKLIETCFGKLIKYEHIILFEIEEDVIYCTDTTKGSHVLYMIKFDDFLDSELNSVVFNDSLKSDFFKKLVSCIVSFMTDPDMGVIFDFDDIDQYAWKIFLEDYEKKKTKKE